MRFPYLNVFRNSYSSKCIPMKRQSSKPAVRNSKWVWPTYLKLRAVSSSWALHVLHNNTGVITQRVNHSHLKFELLCLPWVWEFGCVMESASWYTQEEIWSYNNKTNLRRFPLERFLPHRIWTTHPSGEVRLIMWLIVLFVFTACGEAYCGLLIFCLSLLGYRHFSLCILQIELMFNAFFNTLGDLNWPRCASLCLTSFLCLLFWTRPTFIR